MNTLENKLKKLENYIKKFSKVIVAFSGGVDSTFLAKITSDILEEKMTSVLVKTDFYPDYIVNDALNLAEKINIRCELIKIDLPEKVLKNPANRCYYCKKLIFETIRNNYKNYTIFDGTNYDDTSEYRPGLKALEELDIISPLKQFKMEKAEIRKISKKMNLPTWNKKSYTCLATRFPYNNKIDDFSLEILSKAEKYLKKYNFQKLRVRVHKKLARIVVSREDFKILCKKSVLNDINNKLLNFGFDYVTIDAGGYKKGKYDKINNNIKE